MTVRKLSADAPSIAANGASDAAAIWRVGFAAEADAASAVEILREAATWTARLGRVMWSAESFTVPAYQAFARARELVGGFEQSADGERLAACMLLQRRDPLFWPDDEPGIALYLHKVATRRDAAGRGWSRRLVEWAATVAREEGIGMLRLDTIANGRLPSHYEALGFRALDEEPLQMGELRFTRMERSV